MGKKRLTLASARFAIHDAKELKKVSEVAIILSTLTHLGGYMGKLLQPEHPGAGTHCDRSERIATSMTTSTTSTVAVLKRQMTRASATSVTILTVAFFIAYYVMSMRQQKPTTLAATRLGSISYDIAHFGALWFWANVALDAALGFMSSIAVLWTFRLLLARRRGASTGVAGAAGTIVLAFATFGCPTCTIPLAGTLGIGLFASTLPLFGTELKVIAALPLAISLIVIRKKMNQSSCAVET